VPCRPWRSSLPPRAPLAVVLVTAFVSGSAGVSGVVVEVGCGFIPSFDSPPGGSSRRVLGMTPPTMIPVRLDFDTHAAVFSKAMSHLDHASVRELDRVGFDPGLRELVRVRASQLNGCAYCVDLHGRDALSAGEPLQRLLAVSVYAESPFFTERERAALAFTDSVTWVASTHVPDDAFAAVSAHFSADEMAALLSLIVTINAWNALSVASRAWAPTLDETGPSDSTAAPQV
jgi:AhpD family alkylhydroperoxidase